MVFNTDGHTRGRWTRPRGMKTNITQRSEYVGTFTKSTGEARTMRFTTSEANLKKCGLITVYDVEKCGLRKFNLSTLIGRIAKVPADLNAQLAQLKLLHLFAAPPAWAKNAEPTQP